jgi:hypothetical protein
MNTQGRVVAERACMIILLFWADMISVHYSGHHVLPWNYIQIGDVHEEIMVSVFVGAITVQL